jgi:Squalene-hopene cyclase C-terminal domain
MRSLIFVLAGFFWFDSLCNAQSTVSDTRRTQHAIQRAISWLESDMIAWKDERQCAACHHGPMYLWSINVAKQRDYEVNGTQLEELTKWLIESDEPRIFPKASSASVGSTKNQTAANTMTAKMMGQNQLSQPTIYMLGGVRSMSPSNPLRQKAWTKLVEHLTSVQHENGSFAGRDAWRPIFNTPSVLTLQVAVGLRGTDSPLNQPEAESIVANALGYLGENPVDDSQQALVFQLLLAASSGRSPNSPNSGAAVDALVQRLIKMQRSDGGWAQTQDRASDAFATGQALVAMHEAGLDRAHPSVSSAIEFLVNSQQTDGTWQMSSRPNPENGKPATNLNPITYAATAWATLGMASHVEGGF